jgi:dTDP-4-dehydrorhamnose 3,5-epimerase
MRYPTAREVIAEGLPIPVGVQLIELQDHADERGVFRELYRDAWAASATPVQWNMAWSRPNVLRGVHVHTDHFDHLTVASGEMVLGLHDFRPGSSTRGLSAMLRLTGEEPCLVEIPPGVGHGFYFPVASAHVYGVSRAFDGAEGLACRWDDHELGLVWPTAAPLLSERDRTAGGYAAVVEGLRTPTVA